MLQGYHVEKHVERELQTSQASFGIGITGHRTMTI